MRKSALVVSALALLVAAPLPAAADWCLNLTGTTVFFPFSSNGFFVHFKGSMPKKAGQMKPLTGRVDGTNGGPVFGTAAVHGDGFQMEVGAKFFLDGEEGQFSLFMDGPTYTSGTGSGDYQNYGTGGTSGDANVVDCSTEPTH